MVKKIITGMLQTNTYLLVNDSNKDGLIVDPSGDFDLIVDEISNLKLNIKGILITHGHFDHIGEVDRLKEYYKIKVYVHEEEGKLMEDPRKNLSAYFFGTKIKASGDVFIKDGEILKFGEDFSLKCILVSGHTNNSICFYNEKESYIITGDTLMAGSIGRTDLNNTSTIFLSNNINNKIMTLPGDTIVYPGHGETTKIGIEKVNNPFLNL